MNLPIEINNNVGVNARKLFIFSHTKVGKTELVSKLENNLLIDLENGSNFVTGLKINLVEEAQKEGVSVLRKLAELANKIKEANKAKGDYVYDYITFDTVTALEQIAKELAADKYRKSNMGKSWKGDDIYNLPNGAGYGHVRAAFYSIYSSFNGLARNCIIFLGHVKTAAINKNGADLQARDINLTGKLKYIVCQDVDAIGYLYRDKSSTKNILSFKTDERDLATGARPNHLRGREILISELDEEGNLVTYWDQVFIKE